MALTITPIARTNPAPLSTNSFQTTARLTKAQPAAPAAIEVSPSTETVFVRSIDVTQAQLSGHVSYLQPAIKTERVAPAMLMVSSSTSAPSARPDQAMSSMARDSGLKQVAMAQASRATQMPAGALVNLFR